MVLDWHGHHGRDRATVAGADASRDRSSSPSRLERTSTPHTVCWLTVMDGRLRRSGPIPEWCTEPTCDAGLTQINQARRFPEGDRGTYSLPAAHRCVQKTGPQTSVGVAQHELYHRPHQAPTSDARDVDIWRHRYRSEGRIQDQRVLRDGRVRGRRTIRHALTPTASPARTVGASRARRGRLHHQPRPRQAGRATPLRQQVKRLHQQRNRHSSPVSQQRERGCLLCQPHLAVSGLAGCPSRPSALRDMARNGFGA